MYNNQPSKNSEVFSDLYDEKNIETTPEPPKWLVYGGASLVVAGVVVLALTVIIAIIAGIIQWVF